MMSKPYRSWLSILMCLVPLAASAQSTSPSPEGSRGWFVSGAVSDTTLFHPNPFPSGAPKRRTPPRRCSRLRPTGSSLRICSGSSAPYISNGARLNASRSPAATAT